MREIVESRDRSLDASVILDGLEMTPPHTYMRFGRRDSSAKLCRL
jgi:hypothetical protein